MKKKKEHKSSDEMSFWEHLEVLRWHIIRIVVVIVILAIVAYIYNDFIFDKIILAPKNSTFLTNKFFCWLGARVNVDYLCINSTPLKIINTEMSGQFTISIYIAIITGFILSVPYILWEIWRFVKPALTKKERRYSVVFVYATILLFIIGLLFGYFIIAPLTVNFFVQYQVSNDVQNFFTLRSYISTVSTLTFSTGLVFLFPILAFFLTKIGMMTPRFLTKNRRYIVVIILILAAIITPPDIFSQTLVAIPMYALYEFSIWVSKIVYRRREKAMAR